ncbi:MAG UNVERIFIED_CONTAM: hypothetical protein LVR18_27505, partial [Planctomycetaceae bacterium]
MERGWKKFTKSASHKLSMALHRPPQVAGITSYSASLYHSNMDFFLVAASDAYEALVKFFYERS